MREMRLGLRLCLRLEVVAAHTAPLKSSNRIACCKKGRIHNATLLHVCGSVLAHPGFIFILFFGQLGLPELFLVSKKLPWIIEYLPTIAFRSVLLGLQSQ